MGSCRARSVYLTRLFLSQCFEKHWVKTDPALFFTVRLSSTSIEKCYSEVIEPSRQKTYLRAYTPSEDSGQSAPKCLGIKVYIHINRVTIKYLKWQRPYKDLIPSISLRQAIIIGICKRHRSEWDGSWWAVSSGSMLFDIPSFKFTYKLFSNHESIVVKKNKKKQTTNVVWNLAPKD